MNKSIFITLAVHMVVKWLTAFRIDMQQMAEKRSEVICLRHSCLFVIPPCEPISSARVKTNIIPSPRLIADMLQ